MSNSQTKFGWISSNGLGDSTTDGLTDGGDYNILFTFFNKRGDKNIVSWTKTTKVPALIIGT